MRVEMEQRLSFCGNLPTLPAVAIRIIELANNPEVHLNEVARVIAMDPALVTKLFRACLLYTSPSPRDGLLSRMPSSA